MTVRRIHSRLSTLDRELDDYAQEHVKNEPMLFNCDLHHAYYLGGPITRQFIELLPDEWKEGPLVIDSRVHMLMPGWHPCIPGWHHDDVPRTRADGQPDYDSPLRSRHILALVNGVICPTEFAEGESDFEELHRPGQALYGDWHRRVEDKIRDGVLVCSWARDRHLTEFDDRTWHRGTAATENGWRFFVRASRYYDESTGRRIDRGNARTNEVRRQIQVYMQDLTEGW